MYWVLDMHTTRVAEIVPTFTDTHTHRVTDNQHLLVGKLKKIDEKARAFFSPTYYMKKLELHSPFDL